MHALRAQPRPAGRGLCRFAGPTGSGPGAAQDDALTYPSTFAETSCIAAIEALAAGCLVLTTDLGTLRETTAGFGRLLTLPPQREELAPLYAAMVVREWRAAAAGPAADAARIAAQRDFMRRNATWPLRAAEWVAYLEPVLAEGADGPKPKRNGRLPPPPLARS